eukprot:303128-Rhodomonas_salina.1
MEGCDRGVIAFAVHKLVLAHVLSSYCSFLSPTKPKVTSGHRPPQISRKCLRVTAHVAWAVTFWGVHSGVHSQYRKQ